MGSVDCHVISARRKRLLIEHYLLPANNSQGLKRRCILILLNFGSWAAALQLMPTSQRDKGGNQFQDGCWRHGGQLRGIMRTMNWTHIAGLFAGAIMAVTLPCYASLASPVPDEAVNEPRPLADPPQPDRLQNMLIHAISLIGVRYKFGGSSAQFGFDCSGFVRHVFGESVALELPRSSHAMGKLGLPVEKDDLRPGDLVFYNTLFRAFSHVGIYLGEGRFVHAPSRGKSVEIVEMSDSYWKKRFNGARRLISDD